MNKEELLQELSNKINTGEISRAELSNRFNFLPNVSQESNLNQKSSAHFSVTKMLYVLGAAVVVIGIVIFVHQIWDDLGSFGHVLITLGLGLLFTAVGSLLLKQRPEEKIGSVFHCIGGLLVPGGALVTLSELSTGQDPIWPLTITFGIIFLFYLVLNFVHRNAVLTFFAIANGTAFIYLLIQAIIGGSFYNNGDIYAYLTMMVGASYLLLAYAFRDGWNKQLVSILYFFGSLGFLGAAFSRVFDSELWQMIYFLIVIGGLFLAVYMRSRIVLAISTLFLIAHISYITSKYFADSLGWPISLVILGFIFIGLGYLSININKKYITK